MMSDFSTREPVCGVPRGPCCLRPSPQPSAPGHAGPAYRLPCRGPSCQQFLFVQDPLSLCFHSLWSLLPLAAHILVFNSASGHIQGHWNARLLAEREHAGTRLTF